VYAAARLPYCNQCRRWYHATRSGRIDPDAVRQLAVAAGVATADPVRRARYRLIGCPGGCGPPGLSLFWEQPNGVYSAGPNWLGPDQRDQVQQLLDAAIARVRQVESENQNGGAPRGCGGAGNAGQARPLRDDLNPQP
jgi:hypothetical protein